MSKKINLLLILSLFIIGVSGLNLQIEAEEGYQDKHYKVYRINDKGKFVELYESDDFDDANNVMLNESKKAPNVVVTSRSSKSPLKIVSADRAYVQSYPYRSGKDSAGELLRIYHDKNLTKQYTYLGAHYKMNYYGTEMNNGRLIADVEIQGARGFVELVKTDIIPFIFVEKGFEITLGGNEDFYKNKEKPYNMRIAEDVYVVDYDPNKGYNEILVTYHQSWKTSEGQEHRLGLAPSWLPVGKYYSSDGIYFYHDIDMTDLVSNEPYYSYYQWLPLRTKSNMTAQDLNTYMKKYKTKDQSVIVGNEKSFIENGNKFSMNPMLILSQANLESAFGSSYYATERYNLFGWNAFDSNPNLATHYEGVDTSVKMQMNKNMRGYFSINDGRYYNNSFGNKGAGVATYYASDPYYGTKVGSLAYTLDESLGFKDLNKYDLIKLTDNLEVNVRDNPNTNKSKIWYTTSGSRINQIFPNLGKEGDFYKTLLPSPTTKDGSNILEFDYEDNEEYPFDSHTINAYISANPEHARQVEKQTTKKVSDGRMKEIDSKKQYIINTKGGLNMRDYPSVRGDRITTIADGTVVEGVLMNNGWLKVNYSGKTGYISALYITAFSNTKVKGPSYLPKGQQYPKGDVDGNGEVTMLDVIKVHKHVTGVKKLEGEELKRAKVNVKNKDEEVNMLDVISIHKHVMGIKKLD